MINSIHSSIEANSDISFNPRIWIHPRINYYQMINENGATSNGSLDQQHHSSSDHPTLDRKFNCWNEVYNEQSYQNDHETYQSQLQWRIQKWLRTCDWNQSYPPCQIEEIDSTNETLVSNPPDKTQRKLNNANSTRHPESHNPTFSQNTTVYPDQLNHSDFSTPNSTVITEPSTPTYYSCQAPPRHPAQQKFTHVKKTGIPNGQRNWHHGQHESEISTTNCD